MPDLVNCCMTVMQVGQALELLSSSPSWNSASSLPISGGAQPASSGNSAQPASSGAQPASSGNIGITPSSSGLAAAMTALYSQQPAAAIDKHRYESPLGTLATAIVTSSAPTMVDPRGSPLILHAIRGRSVLTCSRFDTQRTVVEQLAMPGIRRLIAVNPETGCVEGVVSLSDVAAYLCIGDVVPV